MTDPDPVRVAGAAQRQDHESRVLVQVARPGGSAASTSAVPARAAAQSGRVEQAP